MVIGVTTLPMRTMSFQVLFTGCEEDENVHGGAMWARMPLTALVGDTPLDEWPEPIPTYLAQPWDCHCLLYTSPSPRDVEESRMPSSA